MSVLIVDAIVALGIKEWIMDGSPTNETEFNSSLENNRIVQWNGIDSVHQSLRYAQIQTALANGGVVAMAEVRRQRDELLKETDWMASSDYSISDAWKTYRTALRDLPANNKSASWDGTTLGNVTFPTKPS